MKMRGRTLALAGLIVFLMLAILGCQQVVPQPGYSQPPGGSRGPGGMMGRGGMMGPGDGYYGGDGERISMERAMEIVDAYTSSSDEPDVLASEIMEFDYNFYVEFVEEDTGIGAFEALIDPYTGDMYPEPGPNMMWNTKYGTMSGMMWGVDSEGPMTVSPDEAAEHAREFLSDYLPGADVDDVEPFYGYYTLHVVRDGDIYGMLSVNGYTGQVWFHNWHGRFIGMSEH